MAKTPPTGSSSDPRSSRPGVRGPGGPPQRSVPSRSTPPGRPAPAPSRPAAGGRSPARMRFEQRSAPLLVVFTRLPRWLVVVGMAVLLFLGLILTGPLAWLGSIFLLIVATFLGWLLALSWPAISTSARWLRVFVVAALVAIAALKAMGRF